MKKVAVFASGRGSNFEQFCIAQKEGCLSGEISLLVANKAGIGAIETAQKFNVAHEIIDHKDFSNPDSYNLALLTCLEKHKISFIALAGWLRLIHQSIIEKYRNKIINIHPALLPFFGGKGMYGQHVHKAVWESGMLVSGATVHLVDAEFDRGPIILQEGIQLSHSDSPEAIASKVLKIEHTIFPKALNLLLKEKITVKNNRVIF